MLEILGIPVEVRKKNIKNMHLYVKPPNGNVLVSAPFTMSDKTIESFVRTKVNWITKQVEKIINQSRQSELEYVSGETLSVWGQRYYLQTIYGNKYALALSGDKVLLTVRKESTAEQRKNFVREWYRKQLKAEIIRVLPHWETKTCLKAANWQIKYMTTRWGTCNTATRKIWLNLQLAAKSPECLEYIILHELLHLTEKCHSKRFILLMDKYMPLWREIKNSLNRQL